MRTMTWFALAVGLVTTGSSWSTSAMADSPGSSLPHKQHEAVDITVIDGDRAYHLDGIEGLVIYDVSNANKPRFSGRYPLIGWPLGVVVRGSVATIVEGWSDLRTSAGTEQTPAFVRAVELRDPARPAVIGQSTIQGDVRDARATADSVYVLSESGEAPSSQVIVAAFRLDGSRPFPAQTLRRNAAAGWLRVVDGRVILAWADSSHPGTHIEILVDSGAKGLVKRGTVDIPSTIGHADRDASARIDAPDAAHVRILGCRTAQCSAGDMLDVTTLDTTDLDRPRISSTRLLRSPGDWLATRFIGGRLYLASRGWFSLGSPSSTISVIDLDEPPGFHGGDLVIDGVIWNLLPVGSQSQPVVVATRGDATATREQLVVGAARAGRPGRMLGTAVLGDEWVSSIAQASSRAVATCGGYLAVPFRTLEVASMQVQSRIALLAWNAGGLTPARDVPVEGVVDRLDCLRDHLLVFTDMGLWSMDVRAIVSGVARVETTAQGAFVGGR